MITLANALKLLGDDTRLRILRLVAREPLNVSEVTSILGLAQSGISRHLSLLKQAGLVEERREGVWSYYQIAPASKLGRSDEEDGGMQDSGIAGTGSTASSRGAGHAADSTNGAPDPELRAAWQFVKDRVRQSKDRDHDLARLAEVLRGRENFGGGLNEKLLEPGQSWFAWSRVLQFLLPPLDAIDLGCGDGTITVEIGRFARRVVGVDVNPRALQLARKRAERERRHNVQFKADRIEALSEPDAAFDLAVFSQSLHHMEHPALGLKQAARVLKPGGRVLLVDLAPHEERWVLAKLGHVHLGFAPDALTAMLTEAGFKSVVLEEVHQRRGEVFRVLVATGTK
ncbi:MAG: metalloregulator ArsR/SmtB family transcription factor [SAR324 cluster bacterium]